MDRQGPDLTPRFTDRVLRELSTAPVLRNCKIILSC